MRGVKAAISNTDFNQVLNMWLRNIKDIYRISPEELELISDENKKSGPAGRNKCKRTGFQSCQNSYYSKKHGVASKDLTCMDGFMICMMESLNQLWK